MPSDKVGHLVAKTLITPCASRDRLTADCHLPTTADEPVGALEQALAATVEAEPIEAKIRQADREGRFDNNPRANVRDIATVAFESGVISAPEYEVMRRRNALRDIVIRVDDFPYDFGVASAAKPQRGKAGRLMNAPVYIVDGARTPFLKSRNTPGPFAASDLAVQAGRALLLRQPFAPTDLSEVILGCASPSPDEVNIGRVLALRLGCGEKVPGWTVMRNCASGMQALDSAIANIQCGRSQLVLAGGTDALSRAPLLFSDAMVRWLSGWYATKTVGQKLAALRGFRLGFLAPVLGIVKGLTDPVVGLMMGQTAENLAWRFGISRRTLDEFAAESHLRVIAGQSSRPLWRDRAAGGQQGQHLRRG